mmetsp:Transcript_67832/g.136512  ORF Transcript_67832/g.136512 Transcript_67832/m.136512 type:complete len:154 (-) Transcript_67832:321-782(-)
MLLIIFLLAIKESLSFGLHGISACQRKWSHHTRSYHTGRVAASFDFTIIDPVPITFGVLVVGYAAVNFQISLLQGKSGLSNYLKDGKGWRGSAYQEEDTQTRADPMPWLKLPKLDFVEVYGGDIEELEAENSFMEPSEKNLAGEVSGGDSTAA